MNLRPILGAVLLCLSQAGGASGPKSAGPTGEHILPPPPRLDMKAMPPQRRGAVVMPAIGSPGQAAIPTAQNIIRIGEGGNEIVYVGLGFLNRISTPFREPKVIEASGTEFQRVGQDIYFLADKEAPIGMFIAEGASGGGSRVAALTLIPRAGLPGQNIMLVMEGVDGATTAQAQSSEDLAAPPSDYTDALRKVMTAFVQGGVPPGYQEATLRVGAARVGGVLVLPEKMYQGYAFNVFRYRVENAGREPIDLNESSFHEDGVRAVAFWRNARLAPGETTMVFIIADRKED